MNKVRLEDGTEVRCLKKFEALALDDHVEGYFAHGIDVRPGDVLFDVGANIGIFSLRMLQRFEGVRVFAFEPIPAIAAVLRENVKPWPDRVHVLACGVGREPGELEFTYFANSPALSTAHPEVWTEHPEQLEGAVAGGMKHPPKGAWWGKLIPSPFIGVISKHLVGRAERVKCEIRPISEIVREHALDRIDLLKLDIEGGELDALLGIDDEHWPLVRQVVAEVHDEDGRLARVESLLRDRGFTQVVVEQEPAFDRTWLHNVFARR